MTWARDHLPWLVGTSRSSGKLSGESATFVDRIRSQIPQELSTSLVAGTDAGFEQAGPHRIAVTGQTPGSPIRYNPASCDGLDFVAGLGIFFHELGHHLGEADVPTRPLDRWSADWVQALAPRQEALSVFGVESIFADSIELTQLDQSTPFGWTPATLTGMGSHLFLRDSHTALAVRPLVFAAANIGQRQVISAALKIKGGTVDSTSHELVLSLSVSLWTVPPVELPQEATLRVPLTVSSQGTGEIDGTRAPRLVFGAQALPEGEDPDWADQKKQMLSHFQGMVDSAEPLVFASEKPPELVKSSWGDPSAAFAVTVDSPEKINNLNVLIGAPSGLPGISASPVLDAPMRVANEAEAQSSGESAFWCEPLAPHGEHCHVRTSARLKGGMPAFVELVELRVLYDCCRGGSAQGRRPERLTLKPDSTSSAAVSAQWLPVCEGVTPGVMQFSNLPATCKLDAQAAGQVSAQMFAQMALNPRPSGQRFEVLTDPAFSQPDLGPSIPWQRFLKTELTDSGLSIQTLNPWQTNYMGGKQILLQIKALLAWPSDAADTSDAIVLPQLVRLKTPLTLELRR